MTVSHHIPSSPLQTQARVNPCPCPGENHSKSKHTSCFQGFHRIIQVGKMGNPWWITVQPHSYPSFYQIPWTWHSLWREADSQRKRLFSWTKTSWRFMLKRRKTFLVLKTPSYVGRTFIKKLKKTTDLWEKWTEHNKKTKQNFTPWLIQQWSSI